MIARDAALAFWVNERTPQSRERLVMQYAYLCSRGARKFLRPGLDRADLKQIAAIGLLKACDRYDAASRTPFEAYAWLFIVGELMHFVRDHERMVRPPRRLRSLCKRVHEASETLCLEYHGEPTVQQIASYLRVDAAAVLEAQLFHERRVTHSLDHLASRDVANAVNDIEHADMSLVFDQALSRLSTLERKIILALYRSGYSQAEVAARLGYSRRHISRLHRAALRKMQQVFVASE